MNKSEANRYQPNVRSGMPETRRLTHLKRLLLNMSGTRDFPEGTHYSLSSIFSGHHYSPLLLSDKGNPSHCMMHRKASWRSIAAVASVSALTWMLYVVVLLRPDSLSAKSSALFSVRQDGYRNETDDEAVSVQVHHSYSLEDKQVKMYPWKHVAEPHRKTAMQVTSWPGDLREEDVEFRWNVFDDEVGTGTSVEYYFESLGTHGCSLIIARISPMNEEEIAAQYSFTVTVKYVRREIRSLMDRDREKFFNAVSVLQRVPSAVGQQVYGKKYYSKDYFNRLHLYYGGDKDCDHWHDWAGFVTSHVAISLMFEQALQTVDPSIALPYWDFTIEGTEYDWTNFRSSSVFSDDWFGTAAPRNALRTPDRGRFAYVPAMTNAREYSGLYNSYGVLRSPWNNDPSPVVTRHDHIFGFPNNRKPSGCKQYRDAVHQTSWMDLTQSMNGGGHGHIHELMGGTWSADWQGFKENTTERVSPFKHNLVHYMKYLWRSGHLECPESCAMDMPWRDCQCTCANLEAVSKTSSQVLEEAGLLAKDASVFFYDKNMNLIENMGNKQDLAFTAIPGYSQEETEDIYRELLIVLCTSMKIGTHYEATSTNDVTFWVLHPTFDRLWHLQRLENDSNFDETWRDDIPCYGHNPDDIQPFFNLFNDVEATKDNVQVPKKYYTNIELRDLFRPDRMTIPYMYDSFEWPHCSAIEIFLRGRCEDEDK